MLKERNEGIFKRRKNHEKIIEEKTKKEEKHYVEYKPPRGESVLDVYKRTKLFLKRVNKNSIIVTHYTNILCFYSIAKNINIRDVWNKNLINPKHLEIILVEIF